MSRQVAALGWLITRGLVLVLLLGPHAWVSGDVDYFRQSLDALSRLGLGRTLVEYPVPGVAVIGFPRLVADLLGHPGWYSGVVLALAMATDGAFLVLLHHFGRHRGTAAVWVWLWAVPALGATTFARFDLVPGVLVGVAVLLLTTHPRAAAAAAAVATGVKFWPAVVLPALAARAPSRRQAVAVVCTIGGMLAAGSVAVAGWARLVSPFTWQADRGLQIEAVVGTPAMLSWVLAPAEYTVAYTPHHAFEVSGPGVPTLLAVSDLLTVLLVVGLLVLWARAWRQGGRLGGGTVAWLCLASISGFMVSSRVLSPQYLLWLLPAAAAGLAVAGGGATRLVRWAVVLLVATGLTQLVFPVLYGGLVEHTAQSTGALVALALRNLLLVWLTVEAWWQTWSRLGPLSEAASSTASRSAPEAVPVAPSGHGSTTRSSAARRRRRVDRRRPPAAR